MDRIKSAFERAMERAQQLEEPGEEQRLEWRLVPEGRRLGGSFIKAQGSPFSTIEKAPAGHRPYLIRGMASVLTSNLQLPKTEVAQNMNARVIEGLERLLGDRPPLKEALRRVRYVVDQYRQFGTPQREQAYHQLKMQMERQVSDAMSRQMGQQAAPLRVNVETMPEFQQQWLAVSGQIDHQYEQHLEQYRDRIMGLV